MKTIEIDDPGTFYCPMTGEMLLSKHRNGESDALEFSYYWNNTDFISIKPEYEALYETCEKEKEDNIYERRSAYEIFLDKLKDKDDFVLFSLTSWQGPYSFTIDYCINMAYKAE